MKRVLLIVASAAAVGGFAAGAAGLVASPKGLAYDCAQFTNPTVNQVWQVVCNAPQSGHPH